MCFIGGNRFKKRRGVGPGLDTIDGWFRVSPALAKVAELVDALASGASELMLVGVRVPPFALDFAVPLDYPAGRFATK